MKKLSILGILLALLSLSSCVFFTMYEVYVHVDYEWIQSGDNVYIDYTIYNNGDKPLENVTLEFGVDTDNDHNYTGAYDIQEWTNPVDIDVFGSYSVYSFRIPLYSNTAYGVGLISTAMDNPPDDY